MLRIQTDNIVVPDEKVAAVDGFFESFKGLTFDDLVAKIATFVVDFSFRLIGAIILFYIGKFIIKRIYTTVRKIMVANDMDGSLTSFVLSLIKIVLYFILIMIVVHILGVETSSFLAIFASATVAIGLALTGTLQNFAGGVLILFLKPYKVGDFIEAGGYSGIVKEIQIFHTIINTTDNKAILLPNGTMSTSTINNYSLEAYRRVDWTVCLAYGTDLKAACAAIKDILLSDDRIVKQYLEDDLEMRIEEHQEQLEEAKALTSGEDNEGKKGGFWSRFRRKKRARAEQERLDTAIHKLQSAPLVKADCSPFAQIGEMGDSSINITVRAWTLSKNYWGVFFDMNDRFYIELPERGFEFPFPQMDVHISSSQ